MSPVSTNSRPLLSYDESKLTYAPFQQKRKVEERSQQRCVCQLRVCQCRVCQLRVCQCGRGGREDRSGYAREASSLFARLPVQGHRTASHRTTVTHNQQTLATNQHSRITDTDNHHSQPTLTTNTDNPHIH